jgi:hypothetical protein
MIPQGCSYEDDNNEIPTILQESKETSQGHITNLAIIQKFFPLETFQDLETSELLQLPIKIEVPDFKFFEHEAKTRTAEISQQQLDLDKVVQAVKEDNIIVGSLSEAMILGDVDIGQAFWVSTPGIVVSTIAGLIILMIISIIFMMLKIMRMGTALAVLQQIPRIKAQLEFVYNKAPIQVELETNSTSGESLHKLAIEMSSKTGPMAITILVLLILMAWIIYKCCKKKCKNLDMLGQIDLMLEVILEQRSVLIFLKRCRSQINDYIMTSTNPITDLQVHGRIFTTLQINWRDIRLEDMMTGKLISLKSSYRIPWIKAIQLRQILDRGYVARLMWKRDLEIYKVQSTTELQEIISMTTEERPEMRYLTTETSPQTTEVHIERGNSGRKSRREWVNRAIYPILQ